jgi:nitrite reductase/ring-hydroxylating ferredoxin subunit
VSEPIPPTGPELTQGVPFADIPDGGILVGQAAGEPVLLVRRGNDVWAVAAACGHWGAPLADGIVVDSQIRCPWHHAWFDCRTGEAVGPPSPRDITTWEVSRDGDRVRVGAKRKPAAPRESRGGPASVVMVGAGGAADMAAATLRREGYRGPVTLIGRDAEPVPMDRPNLSKDYLSGVAPEEWLPIRDAAYYKRHELTLMPGVEVTKVDPVAHGVTLADGRTLEYGALLLATGAAPIRLDIPGATLPHVFTLRALPETRGILARAAKDRPAVVIGASFIGLEAAYSLRARGMEVRVVAPDARPLERVWGPNWATSCARSTRSTGSSSIWAASPRRSPRATSRSTTGPNSRRSWSSWAWACDRSPRSPRLRGSRSTRVSSSTSSCARARPTFTRRATSRGTRCPAAASASSTGSWRNSRA